MSAEETPATPGGPPSGNTSVETSGNPSLETSVNQSLVRRMRLASRRFGLIVAAVGALVLVGWANHNTALKSIVADHPAMRPVTALSLILGGAALWLAQRRDRLAVVLRRALGATLAVAGTTVLVEHVVGRDLGVAMLLIDRAPVEAAREHVAQPSPPAAMLVALGLALAFFGVETRSGRRPSELFAILALFGASVGVIASTYGAEPLHRFGVFTGTALHTSPACLLLSLGVLLAQPDRGLMQILTRDSLGGLLARRLLPATALVPILLGFTVLAWTSRSGVHDTRGGAALLMTATALAFAALIVFTALSLDRADRERKLMDDRQMRASRALEQAIATRDEFLSVASHELRTPLTALKLQLDSLQNVMNRSAVRPDPRLEKKVSTALRQTDRMSHLIDGLLDVSRIAMGRFRLQLEDFDLVTVVRDVLRRFRDEADGAHTPVDVIAPASVLGRWDRPRLEQVLASLLGNALKYGIGKPVHLRVEATADTVSLVVRDQGIGIAEPDLLRIFQRFERAVPLRHYGGLGLGLYITHQIAQAHGGTISVTSTPGEGATFVVSLPRWTPPVEGGGTRAEADRLSGRIALSQHSEDAASEAGDARGSGVRVTVGRSSPDADRSASRPGAAPRREAR